MFSYALCLFLFQVDIRVTCSHACMMLSAMPCLDLRVYVFISMIYGWILVFTRLYAWIHVLPCLCAKFLHVYMYVSMPICLDLCFHMHVCFYAYMSRSMFTHAYVTGSMFSTCFMLCSMCLRASCRVCVSRPRLYLSCHLLLQPFCHFVFLFCILAYQFKPNLDPMAFVIVHTPWPTSKGLDHPYLHVYTCFLPCFMLVITSIFLGFTMLDALCGFVVVWLLPTPMRPCLDVTIWDASP